MDYFWFWTLTGFIALLVYGACIYTGICLLIGTYVKNPRPLKIVTTSVLIACALLVLTSLIVGARLNIFYILVAILVTITKLKVLSVASKTI